MHTTKKGTCSICGKENTKLYSLRGYKDVCSKHMHQINKFGHPLDDNPRTTKDFNDYVVEGDIATFNVYNQRNEKVAEFMVDKPDIDLIKYKKWRLNSLGYIVTGNCTKTNPLTWLHRILLQPREDEVVDHIDGNPLNNCRSNLRICTQKENLCNMLNISERGRRDDSAQVTAYETETIGMAACPFPCGGFASGGKCGGKAGRREVAGRPQLRL